MENGFRIILADPAVKGVLINIFGGILRCDRLANGVVEAAKKVGIKVPVVIRMEGTNVEEGRSILDEVRSQSNNGKRRFRRRPKNCSNCESIGGNHEHLGG